MVEDEIVACCEDLSNEIRVHNRNIAHVAFLYEDYKPKFWCEFEG